MRKEEIELFNRCYEVLCQYVDILQKNHDENKNVQFSGPGSLIRQTEQKTLNFFKSVQEILDKYIGLESPRDYDWFVGMLLYNKKLRKNKINDLKNIFKVDMPFGVRCTIAQKQSIIDEIDKFIEYFKENLILKKIRRK